MAKYDILPDNFLDRERFYSLNDVIVAAYHSQPIVILNQEGERMSMDAFWGLLPAKTNLDTVTDFVKRAQSTVNARADEVWTKNLYKGLVQQYRCIIPSTGYWEFHYDTETVQLKTKTKEQERKTAMLVRKKNSDIFSIGGLFTVLHGLTTKATLVTYTMFTVPANDKMRVVHNGGEYPFRMPLVLQPEMEEAWLDPNLSIDEINKLLDYYIPSGDLMIHPTVSPGKRDRVRGAELYNQVTVPNLDVDLDFLAA